MNRLTSPRLIRCFTAVFLACSIPTVAAGRHWSEGLDLSYSEGGRTMPYRLYLPNDYDDSQEYPLVLFFHGQGKRGSDNTSQLGHIGGLIDRTDEDYPAILLAPQLPLTGNPWWGYPEDLSPGIFEALKQDYSIDERRVYLTGTSSGGQSATGYSYLAPDVFRAAAIVPMSATYAVPDSVGEPISRLPTWLFHGDNDNTVAFDGRWGSRTYFENVTGENPIVFDETTDIIIDGTTYSYPTAVSGPIRYTELTDWGHGGWNFIYGNEDPALYDWMFAQSIPEPSTFVMLVMGAVGLLVWGWRRKRQS